MSDLTLEPKLLVQPCPTGSIQSQERYFLYFGLGRNLKEIKKDQAPHFEVTTQSGSTWKLPTVNGRLLTPAIFGFCRKNWIVYSDDKKLWLDIGTEIIELNETVRVSTTQFLFIGLVVIDTGSMKISSLVTYPVLRTLFLEGEEDFGAKECDVTLGTFAEITDQANRKNVCDRWGKGIDIAYRSSDFLWETKSSAAQPLAHLLISRDKLST